MSELDRHEEIKKLQERLKKLGEPNSPIYAFRGASPKPGVAATRKRKQPRAIQRSTRVVLPGNYGLTTIPGSLYSTLLLVLGALEKLDLQEALFAKFLKQKTSASATELLNKIGVQRAALDRSTRADCDFKSYCAVRTKRLTAKAAGGDRKSISILSDPKICNNRRWIGDIDEAVNILRGARNENGARTLKNVGILRRAKSGKNVGLMFDTAWRGQNQFCYLYPRKYHAAFRQARALAGE